jgi:hypothetical protein
VRRTLTIGAAAAGLVLVFVSAVGAQARGPHVLDRTFTCSLMLRGGLYELESRAHPGTRVGGSWTRLAYAGVRTGGGTLNLLAWISAGRPAKSTTVDLDFRAFDVRTFGTVGIRGELCNPARATVPLTRSGLRGGAAAPLGDELVCEVPRRVVLRLRAVLESRATLHGQEFESVHVPVREAKLAVRTFSGKPLSFATVVESGKATLYTATGCKPE